VGVLDVFNWQGLSVAPSDTIFDVTPSWTRLDNLGGGLRLAQVDIRRGRTDEFERHSTGTMNVTFNDRDGDVDPTNVDWISRPMAFAVRNPVTDEWQPRFRGSVDDHTYDLDPSGFVKGTVTFECVDALDYFSNFELAPGLAGDTPPSGSEGYVFYEDTAVTGPQIRINQALADCGWPSGLSSIFTGNVNVNPTVYSPGESILAVIQDAADAELPGIGQFSLDRYGVSCFRGRNARFDPATTASTATHWDFHAWTAPFFGPPFRVTRSRRIIRNQAMSYPQYLPSGAPFPAADRVDQVVIGDTSIHGGRSWSATDLVVKDGITTSNTGPEECLAYAQYIVDNYGDSIARPASITFRALRPEDVRGPDLWDFVSKVDISDTIAVTRGHPGGGGVSDTYFVEGISETWRPGVKDLDTGYSFLTMTLDLSPTTYWTTPVGG
jgi:hypothetical protein